MAKKSKASSKSKSVTKKDLNGALGLITGAVTLVFIVGTALAWWGYTFATTQVQDQLVQERIKFPPAGSPALDPEEYPGLQQYAGEYVDTGPKAKAYANEYIWKHMMESSENRTYAEVSTAARENPDDEELQQLRQSLFMGDMLRSSLLTAYAFSVFGLIAGYAIWVCLVGAVLMGLLTAKLFARASGKK